MGSLFFPSGDELVGRWLEVSTCNRGCVFVCERERERERVCECMGSNLIVTVWVSMRVEESVHERKKKSLYSITRRTSYERQVIAHQPLSPFSFLLAPPACVLSSCPPLLLFSLPSLLLLSTLPSPFSTLPSPLSTLPSPLSTLPSPLSTLPSPFYFL